MVLASTRIGVFNLVKQQKINITFGFMSSAAVMWRRR